MIRLAALYLHPVKSCASLARDSAQVRARGLAHDRRWMVVDEGGRFLTGRQLPRMVLLRAEPVADGLLLEAPGMPALTVVRPGPGAPRLQVQVWKDTVEAALAGEPARRWLSEFLGQPTQLVHLDAIAERPVKPGYGRPGDTVSFADAFPLLLLSQAALDLLNARMAAPVPITRFRPNLVVTGCEAHAEDDWKRVRIGGIEFEVVKRCVRCVFTTVDVQTGRFDPAGEPLNTLKGYRRGESGITFGVNLIARDSGRLGVGDAVEVLA